MEGWIKIHRKLRDKGWYRQSNKIHLWIELLLRASHNEREFMFNGENIKLEPGQLIAGRKSLAEATGISESCIERTLTFFEKTEQQIEQQKTNRNRLITILSWHEYQSTEQQTEQQADNKRTTSGHIQEGKERKKLKDEDATASVWKIFWNKEVKLVYGDHLIRRHQKSKIFIAPFPPINSTSKQSDSFIKEWQKKLEPLNNRLKEINAI